MQVPGFVVDRVPSDRVFRPFTALPAHPELALEPEDWRDDGSGDLHPDGRSMILWEPRTPGLSLSMHRRPDGTYSGILGGRREVFDGVSGADGVTDLLLTSFAGLPEDWATEMAEQVRGRLRRRAYFDIWRPACGCSVPAIVRAGAAASATR